MHALLVRHGVIVIGCVAAASCAFFGAQLYAAHFFNGKEHHPMPDYQKMYTTLFNDITDALEDMEAQNFGLARQRLMSAQLKTEEMYISAGEDAKPQKKAKKHSA